MIKRHQLLSKYWALRAVVFGSLYAKTKLFYTLFPKHAKLEKVASDFQFTEGPVWIEKDEYLLFSDIPASRIYKLDKNHSISIYKEPSENSNGLTLDKTGCLICCEHGSRSVTQTKLDGSIITLCSYYNGKQLNSPNDVVVSDKGIIYFTDPPYGIKKEQQQLPFQGVFSYSPEPRELKLVADDLLRPNGLAFSPDQTKLYIDDSSKRRHIKVYDVCEDGSLTNGRIFHDMASKLKGNPDGMKVDKAGNVYCTGAGGIWVFDETGLHLGTILTPETPSNCAWGDEDKKTLFITACSSIYKIRVTTQGT